MNGFASPASGKRTVDGRALRRTWSTSSLRIAFGQRNGYGSPGSGDAPQPAQTSRLASAHSVSNTRPSVELVDQVVPHRHHLEQRGPEVRVATRLEVLERDALLLDPGVVAEVEDPLAVEPSELGEVVGRRAEQVLAEDLRRCDLVEPLGEVPAERDLALALVHRRAVGRDRDDHVVRPEAVVLRDLDRAEHVADGREPERGNGRARRTGRRVVRGCRRPTSVPKRTPRRSVARSETASATSVFMTLWISGTCLSPIPWMLCSPKPL